MKCNKCGEECKENQAFCLKCGNPIQVVPDFNLIEAELASNIGELMDELDKETEGSREGNGADGEKKEDTIPEVAFNDMELKLVNIARHSGDAAADGKTKVIGDISQILQEEGIDHKENIKAETDKNEVNRADGRQEKKPGRKKTALIIAVIVIILAIAVTVFILVAQSVEKSATSYDEYYDRAKKFYDAMNTDDALDSAKDALDKATNNEERLEIRKLLNDIYVLAGDKGEDYAENLEQLITLGARNENYYLALAEYYDTNGKYSNLTSLIVSIEDESILQALDSYVVKGPTADFESGEYHEYMAVTLQTEEGYTIYYTTDSRNPSNYGEKYSDPIQLTEEGENIIKAIAVNKNGVESRVVTYTYNITLTGSGAPKVTPSGGVFSDYTKIKIEVPEGGKAYYTWDNSTPTEKSEQYTEEIDMKRGINVLKVIIIDKYGITSEVTQESYNLQIARAITLNEAVSLIQQKVQSENEGRETDASYESTDIIENDEYYFIRATVSGEDGEKDSVTIYAVNTYDKSIKTAVEDGGKYGIEEETEPET